MYEKEREEKYYDIGSPYLKNTTNMEPPADYGDHKTTVSLCYIIKNSKRDSQK
jgi:hypothetical protein